MMIAQIIKLFKFQGNGCSYLHCVLPILNPSKLCKHFGAASQKHEFIAKLHYSSYVSLQLTPSCHCGGSLVVQLVAVLTNCSLLRAREAQRTTGSVFRFTPQSPDRGRAAYEWTLVYWNQTKPPWPKERMSRSHWLGPKPHGRWGCERERSAGNNTVYCGY